MKGQGFEGLVNAARGDIAPEIDVRRAVIARLQRGQENARDPLAIWALASSASATLAAILVSPMVADLTDPLYGIWQIVSSICP